MINKIIAALLLSTIPLSAVTTVSFAGFCTMFLPPDSQGVNSYWVESIGPTIDFETSLSGGCEIVDPIGPGNAFVTSDAEAVVSLSTPVELGGGYVDWVAESSFESLSNGYEGTSVAEIDIRGAWTTLGPARPGFLDISFDAFGGATVQLPGVSCTDCSSGGFYTIPFMLGRVFEFKAEARARLDVIDTTPLQSTVASGGGLRTSSPRTHGGSRAIHADS